jgi:hypothetical protein
MKVGDRVVALRDVPAWTPFDCDVIEGWNGEVIQIPNEEELWVLGPHVTVRWDGSESNLYSMVELKDLEILQ